MTKPPSFEMADWPATDPLCPSCGIRMPYFPDNPPDAAIRRVH